VTESYPRHGTYVPAPQRKRSWPKVAGVVAVVLLLLCGVGALIAGMTDDPAETAQDAANRGVATLTTVAPAPAVTVTVTATTAAPAVAPKATKTTPPPVIIGDGIYTVGEDIPAGRYKVVERAGEGCYWARLDAADTSDIKDNHIGGGFPAFTTHKGEAVEITGCPDFKRVGKW